MKNKFAERLRELRIDAGLTMEQLAEKIGTKHTAISDWESKKRTPTVEYVFLLCDVFNCTADYLIGRKES